MPTLELPPEPGLISMSSTWIPRTGEKGTWFSPGPNPWPHLSINLARSPGRWWQPPALEVRTTILRILGPAHIPTALGLEMDWTFVPTMATSLPPEVTTNLATIMNGLYACLLPYLPAGWSMQQASLFQHNAAVRNLTGRLAKVVATIS